MYTEAMNQAQPTCFFKAAGKEGNVRAQQDTGLKNEMLVVQNKRKEEERSNKTFNEIKRILDRKN